MVIFPSQVGHLIQGRSKKELQRNKNEGVCIPAWFSETGRPGRPGGREDRGDLLGHPSLKKKKKKKYNKETGLFLILK